jgi:Fur family ferric uptake transcriptional regulator
MTALEILKKHNLKRTTCREEILEAILKADQALSENEIRERLTGNYDRTTLYRSFNTLEENNIIHRIVVENHLVKFALHNSVTHKEMHAHFFCNKCNTVKCMHAVPVKEYHLPDGYSKDDTEVIIKGTCARCKKTA